MEKEELKVEEKTQEPAADGGADKTTPLVKVPKKRKRRKGLSIGRFYVRAGANNVLIALTDPAGNLVASASAGQAGFKGSRKSTPFAASKAAKLILDKARELGVAEADIIVKGIGIGRDAALRAIGGSEIEITGIKDVTPIPHNGPRPKRARRV